LLKNNLVASNFWQLWRKFYKHSCESFGEDRSFNSFG
jgi:hypothetical protein